MPSPSSSLSELRPSITNSLMEFSMQMDQLGFIAHRVLPIMPSMKQSGTYGKIPIESLLQARTTSRAPGSGYNRSNWTFETVSFACEEHGIEEPVDDREAEMYSDFFEAETISAQRAAMQLAIEAEKRCAAAVFDSSTWTGSALTTAITHEWDDATNAAPVDDVNAARNKIWDACGMWANALVINAKVFHNLRNCDQIIDRVESSGAGSSSMQRGITTAQLAQAFDLDYILVGGSPKNTAKEGQDVSISPVWSDEYAMVCKIATTSDIREPCIGRTIHWAEDGSTPMGTAETYRDETVRSTIVRVRHDVDEKIHYVQAGHLLSNVTT